MPLTPWPVLPDHPHAGQPLPAFLTPAGQLQVSCGEVTFGPAHWISPLQCTMPSTDAGIRPPAIGWLRDGAGWELSVERANDPWGETELGGSMRFTTAAGADNTHLVEASSSLLRDFTQAAFTAMTSGVTVPVLREAVAIPSAWGLVTIHVPWQGTVVRVIEQEPLTVSSEGREQQIRRADIILDADPLALAGHLMWDADGVVSWPRANGAANGDLIAAITPLLPTTM